MTNLKSIIYSAKLKVPRAKFPFLGARLSSLFTYTISLIFAASLLSCVNENLDPCDNSGPKVIEESFYISLNILPSAESTRGTTENGGGSTDKTHNGFDNERVVESATLYFFDASDLSDTKGTLLCSFSTTNGMIKEVNSSDDSNYTLTQKINVEDIKKIIGKKLHVYVIANLTLTLPSLPDGSTDNTETTFLNSAFTDTFGSGFSKEYEGPKGNLCPMSNYKEFDLDLSDYSYNSNEEDAYNIILKLFNQNYNGPGSKAGDRLYKIPNTLDLERMIARVDYKDGATLDGFTYQLANHTMNLLKVVNGETMSETEEVYLKMETIKLFNVNNEFYYFRHTVEGDNTGVEKDATGKYPYKTFGVENGGVTDKYNWVYEPTWETKTASLLNKPTSSLNDEHKTVWSVSWGGDTSTPVSDLTAWLEDIQNAASDTNNGYAPWYYIIENTVPSTSDMTMVNCTGIAFRMRVCKKVVTTNSEGEATTEYVPVSKEEAPRELRVERNDGYYQVTTDNFGMENGSPDGYYLTYHYLIPHNVATSSSGIDGNTGTADSPGPMQYGVVRNNVYQLSLTGITSLPLLHEPDNITLSVDVHVLPWDKRYDDDITLF